MITATIVNQIDATEDALPEASSKRNREIPAGRIQKTGIALASVLTDFTGESLIDPIDRIFFQYFARHRRWLARRAPKAAAELQSFESMPLCKNCRSVLRNWHGVCEG